MRSSGATPGAAIGAVAPTADPLIVADAAADARVDAVAATVFVHHAPGASPFGPRPDPGRRRLLGLGLGLASGGCVLPRVGAATAAVLRPTPALTAGPFYPRQRPAEVDADLAAILAKADRHPGVLRQAVGDLPGGDTDQERALMERFWLWAETRFRIDALPPLRHAEDLRAFAHGLYLLAADLIGPVQADRLLADAAAALQLPLPASTPLPPPLPAEVGGARQSGH